jgi:hypothetical protein
MKEPIKVNFASLILTLAIIGMLSYIFVDAFVAKPKFNHKVDLVTNNLDSLKTYVNQRFPEIDSTLTMQNEQLKELKNLKIKIYK